MHNSRIRPKSLVEEPVNGTTIPTALLGVEPVTTQLSAKYTKPPSSTYSALDSDTDCDDELNALLAESWSVTTWSASSSTYTLTDLAREQGAYVVDALRPCSQSLTCDTPHEEARLDRIRAVGGISQASSSDSSVVSRHETQKTLSYGTSLKMFLDEDGGNAPWSLCNPRRPGSICSFCGTIFTAPDHKTRVIEHIRRRHLHMQQNASSATSSTSSASRLPEITRENISYEMFKASSKHSISAIRASSPSPYKLQGSRIIAPTVPAHKDLVVQHTNLAEPHDWTLAILSSLHPLVDARRPNDFLNTLDLIVANLLERFPNDAIAQGMLRAVACLNDLYELHFGAARYSNHPFLGRVSTSMERGASGEGHGGPSPLDSRSPLPDRTQDGDGCEQRKLPEQSGLPVSDHPRARSKKAIRSKKLKDKARLLACPIKKHHEVHGHVSSCTYKGSQHLSSIGTHLKSRSHHQEVPFIAVCRNCWEHTVSEDEYRYVHITRECTGVAQPRYEGVLTYWRKLYLVLFPSSGRVPSPFMDDASWTPRDQVQRRDDVPATNGVETDEEFNFNDISTAQSFLDNSLLEIQPILPIPMDLDLRFLPTRIPDQDQNRPFFRAFTQLVGEHIHRQFDLSDQFTAQLVGPQSRLMQQYVCQLADRIYARVDAFISEEINSRRTQNRQDRMLEHDTQYPMTHASESLWLGPPPPAQDPFTISETANIIPEQAYVDPILFWTPPDFLAPDIPTPATNDRTFVPDLEFLISREGPVPAIRA